DVRHGLRLHATRGECQGNGGSTRQQDFVHEVLPLHSLGTPSASRSAEPPKRFGTKTFWNPIVERRSAVSGAAIWHERRSLPRWRMRPANAIRRWVWPRKRQATDPVSSRGLPQAG